MAIVYGIVRNHGGHITCYSEPDKGTTFHIYLPTLEKIPEQKQEETSSPQVGRGTGRVLLVDDMHSILDVAGIMLESAGLEVIKASSGEEALEKLSDRADAVDLVILDLGMPGLGGEGCLTEMRRRNMTTPVILTSGYAGSPMAKDPGKFGAAAFLTKPYSRGKLVSSALKVLTGTVIEQDTIQS